MTRGTRARLRRFASRVARRGRRVLVGLDPFRMEQRIRSLEVRLGEMEQRLERADPREWHDTERLSRENARAIEHLLHETVRLRRDVDAAGEPD